MEKTKMEDELQPYIRNSNSTITSRKHNFIQKITYSYAVQATDFSFTA